VDAPCEDAFSPLPVHSAGGVAGKGAEQYQSVLQVELRQPFHSGLGQDCQVAANDTPQAHVPGCLHQVGKLGVQFRAAAGDVQGEAVSAVKQCNDLFNHSPPHVPLPGWGCSHVAVGALQVAQVTHVYLQGLQGVECKVVGVYVIQSVPEGSGHVSLSTGGVRGSGAVIG